MRSFPPFLQPERLLGDPVRTYKLRPVPRIIERLPLLPRCQCLMLSAPDSCLGRKAVSEWMRLFFSYFALNELDVGLFCSKLLSLFIKQVLMVEPYQSFISLVETIGHIYRKVNKLNVNFSGLNTVRRNKEPI